MLESSAFHPNVGWEVFMLYDLELNIYLRKVDGYEKQVN
ncbi:hypothetical protein CSCA_0047 [Clostridium scatologenes]|uniref:Uncharacterized protein n=1 Tax=Clostridium scatologenes TaxID=1548 RepID=A0A0E3M650_CLOSL|nr:hypothetical protein CSCA_0047 [Clostridium scatologenes]